MIVEKLATLIIVFLAGVGAASFFHRYGPEPGRRMFYPSLGATVLLLAALVWLAACERVVVHNLPPLVDPEIIHAEPVDLDGL